MFKIGFIGLGIMGESMCRRIIEVGKYPAWVYDINPDQVNKMKDLGANAADSVAEVAENATHIVIMVPNSTHVEDVISKLLPSLKEGSRVIDMSTISPVVSRKLAEQVEEKGSVMIDAPVVKSKAAAESGDLGILVGGDQAVFDEVKPILDCMGSNIIRMGDNGAGLVMKLCHNTLVGQIQNGVNEMITLAQNSGIDIDSFVKAISYGGGQNFYLDSKWQTIKSGDFSPKFPFEHMSKDINLTKELMDSIGVSLPGVENVKSVYDEGLENKMNREDFSASYKIVNTRAKK